MTKLDEFRTAEGRSPAEASHLLFTWLSDDDARADLYRQLLIDRHVLRFQSRASTKERPRQDVKSVFHQDVYLLTAREHIEKALTETDKFSSSPYQALGSGTFMLGLDDVDHDQQRRFASAYLRIDRPVVDALASVAFEAAAVLPSKQRNFDLVDLFEQAALRFVGFSFGFAQADHVLLEQTMRPAYRGLSYQIVGRHFVSEPGAVLNATGAMGALLERVAYLIDLYGRSIGRGQKDEFDRIEIELQELRAFTDSSGNKPLQDFVPVLKRIGGLNAPGNVKRDYSGNELAVIVVGLIAGTVGNIQAGASIAINEFFREPERFESAREAAQKSWLGDPIYAGKLNAFIWEALRLNPPAAFLPRRTTEKMCLYGVDIPARSMVILAVGAATRDGIDDPDTFKENRDVEDPLIFGGPADRGGFLHQCIGQHLAMPVIARITREVLLLDGLAERFDPRTGKLLRLEKLWGIICQKYPLQFNRTDVLTQFPLIVIMKVKTPVPVHAEALRAIIKYGAPRIEDKLRKAEHVHFAWFLFIENDTKLMLATIYDRDFDSYIEHFALQIGPMFDLLFEHIEDAPPMPVKEFPKEFVDTIGRYNNRTVAGYFFSAYPKADVSMITHQFPPEDA